MRMYKNLTSLFVINFFLLALTVSAQAQEPATWQAEGYTHRYQAMFPPLQQSKWAEVGMLEFRADFGKNGTPYDMQAYDENGEAVEIFVLDWTPDQKAIQNSGKVRVLVDMSKLHKPDASRLYLYIGNPDAELEISTKPWPAPLLVIGSGLDRTNRRHGQWHWLRDKIFGAVHVATSPDSKTRVSHSVTALDNVMLDHKNGRLTQAVYLDPVDPPAAISLDIIINKQLHSFYWTNQDSAPQDAVAERGRTKVIGDLPEAGQWRLLELRVDMLDGHGNRTISGLGFSNHGGSVRWGPTAMEAMPVFGQVISHQVINEDGLIENAELRQMEERELRTDALELDVVSAPFFVTPTESLTLTWLVAPSYRYLGPLPDRTLELMSYSTDGKLLWNQTWPVEFTGGDSWQRTLLVPPDGHKGAVRIEGRLLDQEKTVQKLTVIISDLKYVEGLKANGNILIADESPLVFRLSKLPTPVAKVDPKKPTLVLSPEIVPSWSSGTNPDVVFVNSSDKRLGLSPLVGDYARRTAAEWVVACAVASQSQAFGKVTIQATPSMTQIGVPLSDMRPFLSGIIALLRSGEIQVSMGLELLEKKASTPRERALLAACREISFQLER